MRGALIMCARRTRKAKRTKRTKRTRRNRRNRQEDLVFKINGIRTFNRGEQIIFLLAP